MEAYAEPAASTHFKHCAIESSVPAIDVQIDLTDSRSEDRTLPFVLPRCNQLANALVDGSQRYGIYRRAKEHSVLERDIVAVLSVGPVIVLRCIVIGYLPTRRAPFV
jgi:hypothetical protein